MLTNDILNALKGYTANMTSDVALVLQTGDHDKRPELKKFLEDVATVNARITVAERDDPELRSPISFKLEVDGADSGVRFSGLPGGHEFNSFVLALLHASGTPMKLDDSLKSIIAGIDEELRFEVFVSLSCHNCPDVVQTLNQFALLNPKISAETIDGGHFQDVIDARNIQGVPTVFLNGEIFANGKVDPSVLVSKLMETKPDAIRKAAPDTPSLPVQDMVVVGGGPAGAAAAIYAARKGLKVTMVADRIGGQVKDTMGIENFISVSQTTGPELSGNLLAHLRDYPITIREPFLVEKIEKGDLKKVHLTSGEVIETKTVIIASGAKWRELGVPGERENIGNGVAYCPHCDGPFFKGKDVAVIGGGNSGIEAALDLAGIVKSVTVFEFMPDLKADKILIDQAEKRDNIAIIRNAATQQIVADGGKVTAIEYKDRASDEVSRRDLAGVFVQIGLVPNSAFAKDLVETTKFGEIVVNERCETSEPGIFACGDVTTVPYKQIVIAMGEGSKASLSAFDYMLRNFPVESAEEKAAA
jgi:alkyl hydroperoxide reductase subunit F